MHSQVVECDQKYSQVITSLFLMPSQVYVQQFSATVPPKCIISNNIYSIDNANQSFDIMCKLKLLKMIISVIQVLYIPMYCSPPTHICVLLNIRVVVGISVLSETLT